MIRRLFLAGVFAAAVLLAPFARLGATPAPIAEAPTPKIAVIETQFPMNRGGCYWTNCSEAHQNGEGNIPQGSSHYCSKQDRDDDGVACEW